MSTRCQVLVSHSDPGAIINTSERTATLLYRHHDGYPEYMIPLFHEAYHSLDHFTTGDNYQLDRPLKMASIICGADPRGFDIEQGYALHGDIEFLYHITPGIKGRRRWNVTVYAPNRDFHNHLQCIYVYGSRDPWKLFFKVKMDGDIEELFGSFKEEQLGYYRSPEERKKESEANNLLKESLQTIGLI